MPGPIVGHNSSLPMWFGHKSRPVPPFMSIFSDIYLWHRCCHSLTRSWEEHRMAISEVAGLSGDGTAMPPALSVRPGCLQCALERLAGRNYCGSCGNMLRPRCERKQVTVLMADVCGFTALSERLDPEQVRDIIQQTFDIVLETVHEHGGTVNQFLGDGVMALFGEMPGEPHAGRALTAALAVRERLETVRREVRRIYGLEFRVR